MQTLTLIRDTTGLQGTFGTLVIDPQHSYQTVEEPWMANQSDISCIPEGTYNVLWCDHPKHGLCYQLQNVPMRSTILIHTANYGGSTADGFKSDLEGCIGLGKNRNANIPDQFAIQQFCIQNSTKAIEEFNQLLNGQTFQLTIKNNFGKLLLSPA